MQPKHPLLQKCLAQLQALPHLKVETEVEEMPYIASNIVADGQIAIHSPQGSVTYVIEIKSNVTSETITFVLDYLNVLKQRLTSYYRPLLITEKLSKSVTKRLIQENIEFIDATGNCYLNSPALYLLTSSTPLAIEASTESLEITTSTLQLMYVLLQIKSPKIPKPLFNELAESAGISLKTVKFLLNRLCQLKYLQRQPGDNYWIANYIQLLERWELGYKESLRPKLLLGTYTPLTGRQFSEIVDEIVHYAKDEGYLIGGELGGAIATDYLHPIGATLHLPEDQNPISLQLKLRLKPERQGTITFVRQFGTRNAWDNSPVPMLADPLLIHAEMMALATDERVRETSNRLFNQYLIQLQNAAEAF
ncbi:hypothetical protein B7486_23110 [cyanobacterium TDX16]|nr:hypothetical protein B7486_23110 [cyanobacterium TDX16]